MATTSEGSSCLSLNASSLIVADLSAPFHHTDLAPVARLLIFLHPTTRDLLQSLLSQISAFATFVSTTLASPILGSPDSANTHVRSLLSTELAKNRLKDVVDRSGLNLERMGEALETLAGAMMSGGEFDLLFLLSI